MIGAEPVDVLLYFPLQIGTGVTRAAYQSEESTRKMNDESLRKADPAKKEWLSRQILELEDLTAHFDSDDTQEKRMRYLKLKLCLVCAERGQSCAAAGRLMRDLGDCRYIQECDEVLMAEATGRRSEEYIDLLELKMNLLYEKAFSSCSE